MKARARTGTITIITAAWLLAACGGGNGAASDGDEIASLGTTEPAAESSGTDPDAHSANGTSPDSTAVEAPTDPEEAMLAFTECMRDHGIDMPDPGNQGEGPVAIAATIDAGDAGEMEEAQQACAPLMENARNSIEFDPEQQAEMEAEMLEFAQCMRDHGIDMEDPQMVEDGGMMIQMSSASAPEDGGDGGPVTPRDDEEFQAAAEECGGPNGPGVLTARGETED